MMQVINQLYKLNCFNCAVGKIIIKNFIAHNGGDWRSKSLVLTLKFSTTPDGFYFANCVLCVVFYHEF